MPRLSWTLASLLALSFLPGATANLADAVIEDTDKPQTWQGEHATPIHDILANAPTALPNTQDELRSRSATLLGAECAAQSTPGACLDNPRVETTTENLARGAREVLRPIMPASLPAPPAAPNPAEAGAAHVGLARGLAESELKSASKARPGVPTTASPETPAPPSPVAPSPPPSPTLPRIETDDTSTPSANLAPSDPAAIPGPATHAADGLADRAPYQRTLHSDPSPPPAPAQPRREGQLAALASLASRDASAPDSIETQGRAAREARERLGLAAGFALALGAFLTLLVAIPWALYHRIRGSRTLDQGTRRRIFDAATRSPGLTTREAARAAGVAYNTADYHLKRLARGGFLIPHAAGNSLRYFAAGAQPAQARSAIAEAPSAGAERLLVEAARAPGATKTQLARSLGVSLATVKWHVRRLAARGLLEERRAGRETLVYPRFPATQ